MMAEARAQDLREAVVEELCTAADEGLPLVVLVSDSTSTSSIAPFHTRFPDRLINVGIAEQNLLGMAAGLSLGGFISVTANAACFLTARSCEQLKTDICYSNTNVKLLGLNAGVAYGPLASTHHAIDDISILLGFGTIEVFAPSDGREAAQILRYALGHVGPVYIRMDNTALPVVHGPAYRFQPGRVDVVREGKDLTIFALGTLLHEALEAARALSARGVDVCVAALPSLRPLDADEVDRLAMATGAVVTVEEHSLHGGIGSIVSEILADRGHAVRLARQGIPQGEFAKAGPRGRIREYYGIDAAGIEQACRRLLGMEG